MKEWISGLSLSAQDELESTLDFLAILPLDKWNKPQGSRMEDGLSEIRFRVDSVHHRIYGMVWPKTARWEYTMLHGHKKTAGQKQQSEIAIAKKRKKQVEKGEAGYCVLREEEAPNRSSAKG